MQSIALSSNVKQQIKQTNFNANFIDAHILFFALGWESKCTLTVDINLFISICMISLNSAVKWLTFLFCFNFFSVYFLFRENQKKGGKLLKPLIPFCPRYRYNLIKSYKLRFRETKKLRTLLLIFSK